MAREKDQVQAYLGTIGRLEPNITMIDTDAGIASIAISLKRIADALDRLSKPEAPAKLATFGRSNQ